MKWPKSNGKLFVSGGPMALHAHQLSQDYGSIAIGYKSAADILIKELSGLHRHDNLLNPIVYCYRHSLELRLKQIRDSISMFEKNPPETKKEIQGHCLEQSWSKSTEYLQDNNLIDHKDDHDTNLIREANKMDMTNTEFRYPNLNNHQIDLLNLKETVDGLDNYLSSLDDFLSN